MVISARWQRLYRQKIKRSIRYDNVMFAGAERMPGKELAPDSIRLIEIQPRMINHLAGAAFEPLVQELPDTVLPRAAGIKTFREKDAVVIKADLISGMGTDKKRTNLAVVIGEGIVPSG